MESKATHEDTTMEICEADEGMWGGEEHVPTDWERFRNYQNIVETIQDIKSPEYRLTEDKLQKYMRDVETYREWFPNYNLVDPEVEDETFRRKCQETETLLAHLADCVMRKAMFSVKFYLLLLEHMKWLIDQEEQDSQMVEMMASLGM